MCFVDHTFGWDQVCHRNSVRLCEEDNQLRQVKPLRIRIQKKRRSTCSRNAVRYSRNCTSELRWVACWKIKIQGCSNRFSSDTCHIRRKLKIHRSLFDPACPKDPINLLASIGGLDSRLGHGEFSIAVQHVFIIAVCERVVEQCPLLHGWKGWCSRDAHNRNSFRVSPRYCR